MKIAWHGMNIYELMNQDGLTRREAQHVIDAKCFPACSVRELFFGATVPAPLATVRWQALEDAVARVGNGDEDLPGMQWRERSRQRDRRRKPVSKLWRHWGYR
jgi:hypothetical protein